MMKLKDFGDYIVGNFSFKAIELLKRKEPYIVTFRGSSIASFEELKKDFTLLLYTELPVIEHLEEEGIINSISVHGKKQISIYPNPANQFLNFKDANVGDRIEIFSFYGKLLDDHILTETFEVELDHCVNGIYFYTLWRKDKLLFRGKFIIKRP